MNWLSLFPEASPIVDKQVKQNTLSITVDNFLGFTIRTSFPRSRDAQTRVSIVGGESQKCHFPLDAQMLKYRLPFPGVEDSDGQWARPCLLEPASKI